MIPPFPQNLGASRQGLSPGASVMTENQVVLVRAYSGSVKNALAGLSIKEKRDVITLTAILDYSRIIAVRQMIESFNSEITLQKIRDRYLKVQPKRSGTQLTPRE
jgi:hypothetical protein